jgi:hypothetical protein
MFPTVISIWRFLNFFSRSMFLSPFSLLDFTKSLAYPKPTSIIVETFISFLVAFGHSKKSLDFLSWYPAVCRYLNDIVIRMKEKQQKSRKLSHSNADDDFDMDVDKDEDEMDEEKEKEEKENGGKSSHDEEEKEGKENKEEEEEGNGNTSEVHYEDSLFSERSRLLELLNESDWKDIEIEDRIHLLEIFMTDALELTKVDCFRFVSPSFLYFFL